MDTTERARLIRSGDRRALARAITLVESARSDHRAEALALIDALREPRREALRIGLSGTPGVGKSTFIETFGLMLTGQGLKVAVLAVDPSSARSGGSILGRKIVEAITVNGVRVHLEDGSWVLVRASSNKPELVVVVESMRSEDDMRDLFHKEVKPRLANHPEIGAFNQEI